MKIRALHRDDWILVAPLACFLLAAWLGEFGWVRAVEWRTLDWRTQLRAEAGQPPPDERLLVIGIGDRSTKNIEPWPFRRAYHAQLQRLLEPEKPRVLVWDIIFGNRVDVDGVPLDADSDSDFAATTDYLAEQGVPVVFAAVTFGAPTGDDPTALGATETLTRIKGDRGRIYGDDYLDMPFPGLRESGYLGSVDAPRSAGGVVRRMPMVVRVGEQVLPSLSLQAVMRYWGLSGDDVTVELGRAITLGGAAEGRRIPIDEAGMMLINYRYEPMQPGDALGRELPTVEYFDVLIDLHQKHVVRAPDAEGPVPLRDRIVVVGEFATDSGATPRSGLTPLVFLHANVLHNILQSDYVVPVAGGWVWGGAVLLGLLGVVIVRKAPVWLSIAFTLGLIGAYGVFVQGAWNTGSWWLPVVAPVGGFLLLQFLLIAHRVLTEQRAKAEIRGMFGSYLSPVVVEQMVASETTPELGGVTEEITAYFSDIEGFSAFAEHLSAAQLVELLNEYLTACTDLIQEAGGTLDKYIGDAIVAMYGAPVPLPDHAYRACVATLKVQERLAELRKKWTAEGDKWPEIVKHMRTRIGLNTGDCMIGNMGSRSRFSYTMMGDNVNLAARMESGAKSWGVYAMVTEATRAACESDAPGRVVFRPLGRIRVKGRQQPVPIYELVGWTDQLTDATRTCLDHFAAGLACYHRQDWPGALAAFEQASRQEPLQPDAAHAVVTNPSLVYQRIVRQMAETPPGADWDGVYAMTSK